MDNTEIFNNTVKSSFVYIDSKKVTTGDLIKVYDKLTREAKIYKVKFGGETSEFEHYIFASSDLNDNFYNTYDTIFKVGEDEIEVIEENK